MVTEKEVEARITDWYWEGTGKEGNYLDDAAGEFLDAVESPSEVIFEGLGTVKHVLTEGGEGQGDSYYGIFSIGDQFFRMDGYYSSWDGISWDGVSLYEVEPQQVTITEYVKKK